MHTISRLAKPAVFCTALLVAAGLGCASKKSVAVVKQKIAPASGVIVIVDCPTNVQNVIYSKFMNKDLKVKAFNASDIYTAQDVFDIRDFKKVAYKTTLNDINLLFSMQKTYDNLYKLHVYNYELNKAETLGQMKDKWGARYLVLLEFKDWEHVSWARVIDLTTFELVGVVNYSTQYRDSLESVIDYFIANLAQ
jgi:hypothetical protein